MKTIIRVNAETLARCGRRAMGERERERERRGGAVAAA